MHYGIGHMGPPRRTRWNRSHGTSWKDQLGRTAGRPGKEGLGTPQKDHLGRTAGRTWEGGPRYSPKRTSWEGLLEGPGNEGLGTPLGRTSWEGLLEGPGNEGLGTPSPQKDQLGRIAGRTSTGKRAVCLKKGFLV